jgi:DNA-binding transcriptional ArsR family regulator
MIDPNQSLDMAFAALADPTRRAILAKLALGEASVTELAEPFSMSLPAVSRHLKVLEHARLISRSRDAQWRPCRLEAQGLKDIAEWMEFYREFWTKSLDRMQQYVEQSPNAVPSERKQLRRAERRVDRREEK